MSNFNITTGATVPGGVAAGDRVGVSRAGTPYALDVGAELAGVKTSAAGAASVAAAAIPAAQKGAANGVAPLDGASQIAISFLKIGTTAGTVAAGDNPGLATTNLATTSQVTLAGSQIIPVFDPSTGAVLGYSTLTALAAFLGYNVITATAATTPVTAPSAAYVGTAVTGLTTTLTPTGATAYAVLHDGTSDVGTRQSFTGTAIPSLTPAANGTNTVKIYAAVSGGSALATSATFPVTTVATASVLAGFPTSGTNGVALVLTGATATPTPSTATQWAALHDGTAEVGSRTSFIGTTPPSKTPNAAGTFTYKTFAASTGGTALATSPAITVAAAAGSGPNLTMSGATYDASTPKIGSAALSGGSGSAALTFPVGDATFECWFKAAAAPTAGNVILMTSDGLFGFGPDNTTGNARAFIGGGFGKSSTSNICNGSWHHIAFVQIAANPGGQGSQLFVDGVMVAYDNYVARTANQTILVAAAGSSGLGSANAGGVGGTMSGWGEIDAVRISKSARYNVTTFTPFTTLPAWDSNTVGEWDLNSSGISN